MNALNDFIQSTTEKDIQQNISVILLQLNRNIMATATTLLQQQTSLQMQEHNIELMCRICAVDFKIATEGVPIFNTDQLMDKIINYLHIQVS